MPTITAEVSVPRAGTGPTFRLDPAPHRFAAVELSRVRGLLSPTARAARPGPGFFGSWQAGGLEADREYRLPAAEWDRLRPADRLFYRCVTSARRDAWVDVVASVPDDLLDQAPSFRVVDVGLDAVQVPPERLDRLWAEVLRDPGAARLTATPGATAAVVRHSSSPRRPLSPGTVVWVVTVVGPAEAGSVTEVVVPVWETGEVGPVGRFTSVARPTGGGEAVGAATGVLDAPLNEAVTARPERVFRLGPVWVWQDGSPAPLGGTVGGTVLVSASTGELLFASATSW